MHGIHLNITVQRRLENRLLSLKTYRHLIVNRESTIKYDSFKKKDAKIPLVLFIWCFQHFRPDFKNFFQNFITLVD